MKKHLWTQIPFPNFCIRGKKKTEQIIKIQGGEAKLMQNNIDKTHNIKTLFSVTTP